MEECFVFVLQECSVCLTFGGSESQRAILNHNRGYSEKAHCTGEPQLHAMKRGEGKHFTPVDYRKQDQPKTNLLYIVPLYKGAIVFFHAIVLRYAVFKAEKTIEV
jgi:hypothetical protein